MVKYRITGPDAAAYLNRLTVRNAAKLSVGGVHYTVWCDDDGKILDDGTLFRLAEDEYRICCQERHLPWLLDSAVGFDVEVAEVTEEIAALSLQGPCTAAVLKAAGFDVSGLKPFRMASFPFDGGTLTISRTGFTGDLGYELWTTPEPCAGPVGSSLRSRPSLRHPPDRLECAQHGAHRGWLHHHQSRFRRRRIRRCAKTACARPSRWGWTG